MISFDSFVEFTKFFKRLIFVEISVVSNNFLITAPNGGCTNLFYYAYALMGGGQVPHFQGSNRGVPDTQKNLFLMEKVKNKILIALLAKHTSSNAILMKILSPKK